jgi:plastocyanin
MRKMLARTVKAAAGAALVAVVGGPAPASADKVIEAQTVWRFDAMSYTIDQGEPLTFSNRDELSPGDHNVTASDTGPDGKPLFASATISKGQDAPVEGARQLKTGSYDFICTIHPFMQATLMVTDKGAPLPPPGGGPPPPSSPPPPPPPSGDTRAPAVRVALRRASLRRAVRRRRFRAVVTADEPATLQLRLTARVRGRVLTVGTASGRVATANGRASVTVRVRRSALRGLRRARRLRLTLAVEARDAAGNVGTATARRTVRR